MYEAPHRLLATLRDIVGTLGDRPVAVARELTKIHEEIWRGTVSGAIERFTERAPRGEFTLVVGGASEPEQWTEEQVRGAVAELLAAGISARDAASEVAARSGWSKRNLYRITQSLTAETQRPQRKT